MIEEIFSFIFFQLALCHYLVFLFLFLWFCGVHWIFEGYATGFVI